MRSTPKEQPKDIGELADDARALLEATAHVTGQTVERARKRLAVALKHGKANGKDVIDASADIATDNITELRDRILSALDYGKDIYHDVHDGVVSRTKAADHAVHENPYRVMGIALGVGAIIGFVMSSRHSRKGH